MEGVSVRATLPGIFFVHSIILVLSFKDNLSLHAHLVTKQANKGRSFSVLVILVLYFCLKILSEEKEMFQKISNRQAVAYRYTRKI